jgi:hypothetical protein
VNGFFQLRAMTRFWSEKPLIFGEYVRLLTVSLGTSRNSMEALNGQVFPSLRIA